MNIFLTGASGFLGFHVARLLVERGHRVIALVRPTSQRKELKKLPIQWIKGSLSDLRALRQSPEPLEAVIHIAGIVKALSKEAFFKTNAQGTENLVQEILSRPTLPKVFIQISTLAVHSPTRDGPDFCLPADQCHPVSHYGESKLAGEKSLGLLKEKVRSVILRPPVIYGPQDREVLLLFKAAQKGFLPLYRRGQSQFSMCYVTDVAQAIITLLENPPQKDEIFCLDDGVVHTWKSVAQVIAKAMKRNPLLLSIPHSLYSLAALCSQGYAQLRRQPVVFTVNKMEEISQPSWVCGYQKLNEKTGWRPQVDLKRGIDSTLRFYREMKWL